MSGYVFRLSQKKTCKGCKAKRATKCILGFEFEPAVQKIGAFLIPYSKPLEPCYKPLINKDLKRAIELIENK